jgi:hypothetical protein
MEPAPEPTSSGELEEPSDWPRYASIVLGAWLVIFAISWAHPPPAATNTWIFGLIIIVGHLATMHTRPARWMQRTVAAGLFITSLPLAKYSVATALNNVVVAAALVSLSVPFRRKPYAGALRLWSRTRKRAI